MLKSGQSQSGGRLLNTGNEKVHITADQMQNQDGLVLSNGETEINAREKERQGGKTCQKAK